MNPWRQTQQYDPDATFIKQWIPALHNLDTSDILQWETLHESHKDILYPPPIIPNHILAAK